MNNWHSLGCKLVDHSHPVLQISIYFLNCLRGADDCEYNCVTTTRTTLWMLHIFVTALKAADLCYFLFLSVATVVVLNLPEVTLQSKRLTNADIFLVFLLTYSIKGADFVQMVVFYSKQTAVAAVANVLNYSPSRYTALRKGPTWHWMFKQKMLQRLWWFG